MDKIGFTSFASALPTKPSDGDSQWVQLLPMGTANAVDGRGPWHIRDAPSIVAASRRFLERGMPVDFDHAMESKDHSRAAPAAGWIEKIEAREDGLWGFVSWTSEGREKIAGRMYRFISPVFTHTKDGEIKAILRAGLTNTPAIEMEAVAASEDTSSDMDDAEGMRQFVKDLFKALSIDPSTPFEEALEAVRKAVSAPAKAQASSMPMEDLANMLLSKTREDAAQEAETAVATAMAQGALPPALKDWGTALASSDPKSFRDFVTRSPLKAIIHSDMNLSGKPPHKPEPGPGADICAQLGLPPDALDELLWGRARLHLRSCRASLRFAAKSLSLGKAWPCSTQNWLHWKPTSILLA